jgi:hypothetical protein
MIFLMMYPIMSALVKTCRERYGMGQGASKGIQARQK